MTSQFAVECDNLGRIYTSRHGLGKKHQTVALEGLNLTIPRGVVFGVLGPNGAGKTTLVRILSTLLTPTSGKASVAGFDVVRQAGEVRRCIGQVLGGDRGYYGRLSGRENLLYFAALNHLSPSRAAQRVDEMLAEVGMAGSQDEWMERYSRGMKQRIHIARGLMMDPDILFLDEPTIGLDPFGAQEVRQLIPRLVSQGKTVLLTTHYMFEADSLCHTIALINKGRLVVTGSPTDIKHRFSKINVVELTVREVWPGLTEAIVAVPGVRRVDLGTDGILHKITVLTTVGLDLNERITALVPKSGVIVNIINRDPSLEEAYLNILS